MKWSCFVTCTDIPGKRIYLFMDAATSKIQTNSCLLAYFHDCCGKFLKIFHLMIVVFPFPNPKNLQHVSLYIGALVCWIALPWKPVLHVLILEKMPISILRLGIWRFVLWYTSYRACSKWDNSFVRPFWIIVTRINRECSKSFENWNCWVLTFQKT